VVPDVLVLDLGLPDMDGFELARRLREAGARTALTIALSGFGDEQARSHAAQAGFDHYMVKPARLEELSGLLAAFQSRRDEGGDRRPPL
jgi:DNA-binding response OmpR family regulator